MSSLIVVMLYDFQDRKFQPRSISNSEVIIEEVREVENVLYSFKTKLAAALARSRIKHDALTIEYILPETVRKQEQRASTLPLYAWINTAKASLTDIFHTLKKEGFTKVNSPSYLDEYTYCMDTHCQDLLVFPPHLKDELNNLEIFIGYKLLLQDKSHSLAVHSVKALMNMDDDIIVANPCPGFTVAHMSVLAKQFTCNIFVCGIKSETREAELQDLFTNMECKNIKLLKENFTDIDPTDHKLQKAKVILLLPQCSGSGVSDPVEFVLNEHGDTALLRDLSQGSVAADTLNDLAKQQLSELFHAMKFNKVQGIVYCTCSVYHEENEDVINKALKFKMEGSNVLPYRLGPPVIPLCSSSEIISSSDNIFKVEPSEITNGCFLAVLTRERDPSESVSVKDVLARAAAKGLLEGIEIPKSSKRDERKKKAKAAVQKAAPTISVTQTRITEFLNRENSLTIGRASTSKPDPAIPQKSISSFQFKKPSKQVSISPVTVKNASNLSSMSRILDRQASIAKPKTQEKMIVLKPVQIVLPPVRLPYYTTSPAFKVQGPIHYYHQRWHAGVRSSASLSLIPTLSIVGKSKETLPFRVVRHPRPWL
ncbi:hypothetical protein FKM82_001518 [Ascaphus truei]